VTVHTCHIMSYIVSLSHNSNIKDLLLLVNSFQLETAKKNAFLSETNPFSVI